ncbi:hypothetical protein AB0G04_36155 [Actinoplanes sp. NPDC023801]|uniref:hypothetical protein n=1 Tax=Actinoplanes sp. NPDC023801 TaxID=3154595 RepID=UPI0033C27F92
MQAQDSPFPPAWWAFGLESAGVPARPETSTYGRYDFEVLPPIPRELTGDLAWLAEQAVTEEWGIGATPVAELPDLEAACDRLGLTLPVVFLDFLRMPSLQSRIRSCTGCYISVGPEPVRAPGADGHLIRFLADQQDCLYWYLYVTATDHAVVTSADYYGGPDEDHDGGDEIEFCGESFESFLYRFWLENEIWYSANEDEPMPAEAEEYIRRYRAAAAPLDH